MSVILQLYYMRDNHSFVALNHPTDDQDSLLKQALAAFDESQYGLLCAYRAGSSVKDTVCAGGSAGDGRAKFAAEAAAWLQRMLAPQPTPKTVDEIIGTLRAKLAELETLVSSSERVTTFALALEKRRAAEAQVTSLTAKLEAAEKAGERLAASAKRVLEGIDPELTHTDFDCLGRDIDRWKALWAPPAPPAA